MSGTAHYDVIIIGGGMVGTTLACALRGSSLRVALIEPSSPSTDASEQQFDLRVSAITRASQRIFETLDVWSDMQAQRVSPFRQMHVWDSSGIGEIHFDSAELGEPLLGHIIENRVINTVLFEAAIRSDSIDVIAGRRCTGLQREQQHWQLMLDDGRTLNTNLLVGADGSRSWLRQQLQIRVRGWDYDHTALVTYVKTALTHQETAWQRFLPTGPLAFLPLTDGYSSIVWSTRHDDALRLQQLPVAEFARELEQAFASRLGAIETVGARAVFPLRFFMTEHYVMPGLALIGDAAHTVHPLAGQGVNLGLTDAASLAEILCDTARQKRDIGGMVALRRYERWRRAENMAMLVAIDSFQRIFDTNTGMLQWMRNAGMWGLDHLPPVKNHIISYAMGEQGNLPRLACGIPVV